MNEKRIKKTCGFVRQWHINELLKYQIEHLNYKKIYTLGETSNGSNVVLIRSCSTLIYKKFT